MTSVLESVSSTTPEAERPLADRPAPAPAVDWNASKSARAAELKRDDGDGWVPVRTLHERHRARVLQHLRGLTEDDRYLRFGYAATDAQIDQYVASIDFDRDEVFGIFNRRLDLVAMAHLSYTTPQPDANGVMQPPKAAEFGVSVDRRLRGRRLGSRLFHLAILHARNRDVGRMYVHALSENIPMLRMARSAGATVERDGGESEALLKLPPHDLASKLEAWVQDTTAELDYTWKQQQRSWDGLLNALKFGHGARK